MSKLWQYAAFVGMQFDNTIRYTAAQIQLFDKVRVALFITWMWAFAGVYVARAFETMFRTIMSMPDSWYSTTDSKLLCMNKPIINSEGNHVKILAASDGKRNLTNKLKIFLQWYWMNDSDGGHFSFAQLSRLLNCSMLYCSYLLTDKDGNIDPNMFLKNVHQFMIRTEAGRTVQQDGDSVPFGDVRLDGRQSRSNTFNDLRDQLRSEMCASDITIQDDDEAGQSDL